MMIDGVPNHVLIARACHFLELARLQLENGDGPECARSMARAVDLLEQVKL